MKPLYDLRPPNKVHQWIGRHRWWVLGFWAFAALTFFAFSIGDVREDGGTQSAVVHGVQGVVCVWFFVMTRALVNAVDRYNNEADRGEG